MQGNVVCLIQLYAFGTFYPVIFFIFSLLSAISLQPGTTESCVATQVAPLSSRQQPLLLNCHRRQSMSGARLAESMMSPFAVQFRRIFHVNIFDSSTSKNPQGREMGQCYNCDLQLLHQTYETLFCLCCCWNLELELQRLVDRRQN